MRVLQITQRTLSRSSLVMMEQNWIVLVCLVVDCKKANIIWHHLITWHCYPQQHASGGLI